MKYYIYSAIFICALSLAAASLVPRVHAQQTTQITISPVTFELTANPGDSLTNHIKISNVSDANLELEAKVENISGTGEQGQVQLTEEDTQYSLSSWVKANPAQITLGPHETKTVSFTIDVPKNAEPGGHYGSLLVGTSSRSKPEGTVTSIVQRVGSLLLVRVTGETREEMSVAEVKIRSFTGTWEEITMPDGKTKVLQAQQQLNGSEKYGKYFQKGPLAIDVTLYNTGTVHAKPIGWINIRNIFGRKIAELPIDQRNVFPGNKRTISVIFPKKGFWGGYYRANVVGLYGSQNKALSADSAFWAFPLPAAIGLGALFLFVIIARKRLRRMIRVLFKGE